MSHHDFNGALSDASATNGDDGRSNPFNYNMVVGAPAPYMQPSLIPFSGSGIPPYRSLGPSWLPEGTHPSRDHPDPLAIAPLPRPEHSHVFHRQSPQGTLQPVPTAGIQAAAVPMAHADTTRPNNGHWRPALQQAAPPPRFPSPPAADSNTRSTITGDAIPLTATGAPQAPAEITLPHEKPVISCDFEGGVTLGDALNNSSRVSKEGSCRAFPTRVFPAKLAFWLKFDLGSGFPPWRKQITVVTTRKGVTEQPSKARLAYLIGRAMNKYLRDCRMRKIPFPYTLDNIVLRRIDLVSKGTLRPRLYIRARARRTTRATSMATC